MSHGLFDLPQYNFGSPESGSGYMPLQEGEPQSGPEWLGRAMHLAGRLGNEAGMSAVGAAAIVGGFVHESGGLMPDINEGGHRGAPNMQRGGGFGYGQWTGQRKQEFMGWCQQQGLSPVSVDANEGFCIHELQTKYRGVVDALQGVTDLHQAVVIAEKEYEQAGIKAYGSRLKAAEIISQHMGGGAPQPEYAAAAPQNDFANPAANIMPSAENSSGRRRHDRANWHANSPGEPRLAENRGDPPSLFLGKKSGGSIYNGFG